MNNGTFELLCGIYENSAIPTAVICGGSLFKNKAAERLAEDSFFRKLAASQGTVYELADGMLYTANVISHGDIRIAEIIRSESIDSLLNVPAVRKYAEFVFRKLRHSVNVIAVAADDIHSCLSQGSPDRKRAADRLNSIDATLTDIISLIIDPEQLVYLMDDPADSTVCLKDELEGIASDISEAYNGYVQVECDLEDGLYTRMNRSSLKTVLSDTAERLCCGNIVPDKIILSSSLRNNGTVNVSISSECSQGRKHSELDSAFVKDSAEDIFFEYVCDSFCTKYNGSLERRETADGSCFTLSFPMLRKPAAAVYCKECFGTCMGRFDTARVRLGRFAPRNRYDL